MPTISRILGFLASCLFCLSAVFAQTNSPPSDPHEMVKREPRTLTKPAERSGALDLLNRVRKNYDLHGISAPYVLKVSFETNGAAQTEGEGRMEELSDGGSRWRWTAQMRDIHVMRVGDDNHVYGTNPSEPVPLRIQMVRSALLRPIGRDLGAAAIRAADVERDGKAISCLLLSRAIPPNPAPRSWVEVEYCVDPATGLLQMWSEAPGIYAVYDYNDAAEFHGHIFPRQISIFEDGRLAVQAHVESLEDAPSIDPNLFKPMPEMVDAGGSFALAAPNRFPMRVDPSNAPTSTFFQPVIVHATLDAEDGSVLDAEALQNSDHDLSRSAIDLVRNTAFDPTGFQQEAFINVQFHFPAVTLGGPPIFHSSVRWVVLDHPVRIAKVKRPRH